MNNAGQTSEQDFLNPPNKALHRTPAGAILALSLGLSGGRPAPVSSKPFGVRATHWHAKAFGLLALFVVFGVCGCTVVTFTYVDPSRRVETEPSAVQVLRQEPDRPYRVVGQFRFEDKGWGFTREQLDERIRREAARLGGEAVVIDQTVESHFVSEGLLIGHTAEVSQRVLFAKVIVFKGEEGR